MYDVAWSSDQSALLGVGAYAQVAESADGVGAWTTGSLGWSSSPDAHAVTWSSALGLWVAAGTGPHLSTSSDGAAWTEQDTTAFGTGQINCALWSPELGLFVTGTSAGSGWGRVVTSPDGITWTLHYAYFDYGQSITSIAWSPELGLLVAVGTGGLLSTSPDGATWTAQTSGASSLLNTVIWAPDPGVFIAAGYSDDVYVSSDGVTWAPYSSGFGSHTIRALAVTTVAPGETHSGTCALSGSGTLGLAGVPAIAGVVTLGGGGALTAVESAVDLGAVSVVLVSAFAYTTLAMAQDLGAVTMQGLAGSGDWIRAVLAQPGTLAAPYAAYDTDSFAVDLATGVFQSSEPVPATGPADAPSIWYEFTESQMADWLATTSGFAHGATIELYTGPHGATAADDVTLIATDGIAPVDLGAVSMDATDLLARVLLHVKPVNLGAVTMAVDVAVEGALT
jgi:hypothetical protein